ncbi:hypothetical protein BRADI_2g16615v3 [Brachypodium distachyon]|uniref:Uncharacterized protein n=1 Tax=Brachypodium distachyon TaxID=15368 RepID=A0A2K2D8V3_BRADI|nr:hypothetical protein BRADI_2g16615v3 [Brachypodium distachyon]
MPGRAAGGEYVRTVRPPALTPAAINTRLVVCAMLRQLVHSLDKKLVLPAGGEILICTYGGKYTVHIYYVRTQY